MIKKIWQKICHVFDNFFDFGDVETYMKQIEDSGMFFRLIYGKTIIFFNLKKGGMMPLLISISNLDADLRQKIKSNGSPLKLVTQDAVEISLSDKDGKPLGLVEFVNILNGKGE